MNLIVKILSPSTSFAGIDYNERKNDQGNSELLEARNFEGLGHVREELIRSDYINYIRMVARLNRRTRNKQFHAVISTKERTHTPESLRDIAVKYLEKMGYGKNPYLIYVHFDTAHTHVHLISTMVDKQGKKVNDVYNWPRSYHALHEILQEDPRREAAAAIDKVLGYNFSTMAQGKLLFGQQGFKIRDNARDLDLIKYGKVLASLEKRRIEEKVDRYVSPENRISQLKNLFHTYMPGLNPEGFTGFLNARFDVDLVFHSSKKKAPPEGYSIIDNGNREVLNGEQVMSLSEILSATTKAEKLAKAKAYIQAMVHEDTLFSGMRREISNFGFEINTQGTVRLKGEMVPAIQLTGNLLDELKYNDRIASASQYACGSDKEVQVLARLFMVDPAALSSGVQKVTDPANYHRLLENIIEPNKADDILASLDIRLVKSSGNYFLVDEKEKAVVMIEQGKSRQLDLYSMEKLEMDQKGQPLLQDAFEYSGSDNLGEAMDRAAIKHPHFPVETRTKRLTV